MKVLLIGSGGREHALYHFCKTSPLITSLKVYPGNGGIPIEDTIEKGIIDLKSKESVQNFLKKEKYEFVIIGPEDPLVDGMGDWVREIGIFCFGPSKFCAQLEGSKSFAKEIMQKAKIPTGQYAKFQDLQSSIEYVNANTVPIVIKADGLAAGKGVTVAETKDVAIAALKEIFLEEKFGSSMKTVVIEEFLLGEEASVFAVCDGKNYVVLPAAQDHKRAFDGDTGPNTGGMGAYAPAPIATPAVIEKVKQRIIEPILQHLASLGHPYHGLLYCGIMIHPSGDPFVVEFNCRFGDPETQIVLELVATDVFSLLLDSAKGTINPQSVSFKKGFTSLVVLAAKGYPGDYKKNISISLPKNQKTNVHIFHAGTYRQNSSIYSNGGRVLGVSAYSESLESSLKDCYDCLSSMDITDAFYRTDIGKKALK